MPRVTASSAAATCLGWSLTERGAKDRLMLATGTRRPGDPDSDWPERCPPGTTLGLCMGVAAAPRRVADLAARGAPGSLNVDVVAEASTARQTTLATTLESLPGALRSAHLEGAALILVRWPKTATGARRTVRPEPPPLLAEAS